MEANSFLGADLFSHRVVQSSTLDKAQMAVMKVGYNPILQKMVAHT
jgi:hypothetical protein